MKRILSITAVGAALFLTGCATEPYNGYNGGYNSSYNSGYNQPNYQNNQSYPQNNRNYNNGYNGYNNTARTGIVYSVRQVAMTGGGQTSGAGIAIGAVAGGLLGNQIGHGGGRAAATVLGAVGGGALGNTIEKNGYTNQRPGIELQVRVEQTGEMVTIVQPDQGQNFSNGSRVRLYSENGSWKASY